MEIDTQTSESLLLGHFGTLAKWLTSFWCRCWGLCSSYLVAIHFQFVGINSFILYFTILILFIIFLLHSFSSIICTAELQLKIQLHLIQKLKPYAGVTTLQEEEESKKYKEVVNPHLHPLHKATIKWKRSMHDE